MPQKPSIRSGLSLVVLAAGMPAALALTPWPRENIVDVEDGRSASFVGEWSMEQAGRPTTTYATCDLPVRIEAADETHIFYRGPKDPEPEAATELLARDGRTHWRPIAGGPDYFTVWVSPDRFHLYQAEVENAVDWGEPYAFTRCD
jgi:hypothetical protein